MDLHQKTALQCTGRGARKGSLCTPNSVRHRVVPGRGPGRGDKQQAEPASGALGPSVPFLRKQAALCLSVTSLNIALYFSSLPP